MSKYTTGEIAKRRDREALRRDRARGPVLRHPGHTDALGAVGGRAAAVRGGRREAAARDLLSAGAGLLHRRHFPPVLRRRPGGGDRPADRAAGPGAAGGDRRAAGAACQAGGVEAGAAGRGDLLRRIHRRHRVYHEQQKGSEKHPHEAAADRRPGEPAPVGRPRAGVRQRLVVAAGGLGRRGHPLWGLGHEILLWPRQLHLPQVPQGVQARVQAGVLGAPHPQHPQADLPGLRPPRLLRGGRQRAGREIPGLDLRPGLGRAVRGRASLQGQPGQWPAGARGDDVRAGAGRAAGGRQTLRRSGKTSGSCWSRGSRRRCSPPSARRCTFWPSRATST